MKITKSTRPLTVVLLTSGTVFTWSAWREFPAWQYAHADPIEKVEINTQRILTDYERTGNAALLHKWVKNQDGAFNSAANYTLGDWAMRHQKPFLTFLETMDAKQNKDFAEGFGFALTDFGKDKAFRKAFQGFQSSRLTTVFQSIPKPNLWPEPTGQTDSSASPAPGSAILSGYKKWTRVNPTPHRVYSRIAVLCSATPKQIAADKKNPHNDKFVTVYVNSPGARAMMHQKTPTFPLGSVIVKEKLSRADSRTPELLTVMRKREAGYNPQNGDWEYLVLNGTGSGIKVQGRLPTCQSCHAQWRNTSDFVSRDYFTKKMQGSLQ